MASSVDFNDTFITISFLALLTRLPRASFCLPNVCSSRNAFGIELDIVSTAFSRVFRSLCYKRMRYLSYFCHYVFVFFVAYATNGFSKMLQFTVNFELYGNNMNVHPFIKLSTVRLDLFPSLYCQVDIGVDDLIC